ncbi:MAG: endonuclease [Cyclobacteriaceae bacterium]
MKNFIAFILGFASLSLYAQSIPDGYYDGTSSLSGEALKVKLHQISRNHTKRSYSEFRDTILPDLDEDPDNSDNIILFYKNNSIPKQSFASNNEPDFWNREHTWPSSHGFSSSSDTAYTDVHNLRPSDATVNTSKSNKDFNNVEHIAENEEGEAPDTYTTSDFFEPRDEIKGDVARILFYMDMRYESGRLDLDLVDRATFTGDPELGVLSTLIQWHESDPVDQYEIDRHEKAYGYQNNRNPFVDHPEWVADIWGSSSDPYLTVDQLNFSSDFGRVAFGESFTQQYTLVGNNLAADVTVSVEAPFSLSGDNQTFADQITLTHTSEESQETFTIYLKFTPAQEDGTLYEKTVTHSTSGANDVTLNVKGTEGKEAILTISEARSESLGSVVKVTGVVIDEGNNSGNSRVIYDGTAGVVVRSFDAGNESSDLVQGDSVVVSGGLSEYNNLLQIEESPIVISMISQGASLPSPKEVTIAEVGEHLESQLVILKGVYFDRPGLTFGGGGSAGNFTIYDGDDQLTLRIGSSSHPLVGTLVPEGEFDIIGIVGQFGSDYQISPRSENDVIEAGSDEALSNATYKLDMIYPNPAEGLIELHLSGNEFSSVQIYDLNGSLVLNNLGVQKSLNVSSLKKGLYFVIATTDEGIFYSKLIKE